MSEQMSDEMGAPGYPAGDSVQEDSEQGGGEGDLDPQNEEMIRRRAYEISQGEDAGTAEENWARAEREILTEQASP
jgi:DUF2934 family protein